MRKLILWLIIIIVIIAVGLFIWKRLETKIDYELHGTGGKAGEVKDEAMSVGLTGKNFPAADEDYYADMDYGISKRPDELYQRISTYLDPTKIDKAGAVKLFAQGRNNWIVWTAGNDRLWDILSVRSKGNLDLLKTVSNHPSLKFSRSNRWQYLGLVNEPCFKKGAGPRADRFGLYLDERDTSQAGCGPADPFENEQKYPGAKVGARGKGSLPVGSYYGYATGIVGLRLFPNPAFDEKAQKEWNAERYYTDPDYYNNEKLVKPYRVGMSCGFCHVGPNPSRPPADFENPRWENLNSNPGAQYFWIDRIFMWNADASSFVYQLFHTSRPGALDTSLVSSDQINNPRTMNAVYNLQGRLDVAAKWGTERLAGGSLDNAQFNQQPGLSQALNGYFKAPDTVFTPRVLKDGADSVGALGALNRVYINIGLFSEEWLLHFVPLIGAIPGNPITPIPIKALNANSAMWQANVGQTAAVALFFLGSARPDLLSDAPGGSAHLADSAMVPRGKVVFAERCARCHSSKQPEYVFQNYFKGGCVGPNYLGCWNEYWQHTKTPQYKQAMTQMVNDPAFLTDNFLSTELRIPVTLLETNACSPLATNAIAGDTWDNFSSQSYKDLPSVGTIQIHDPWTGAIRQGGYKMPAGGRGYTRPASLVSVWSTAPFLLNNSLGPFRWEGTVEGRMDSFNRSIEQLLWPEKRDGNRTIQTASGKTHPGQVDVTPAPTYLYVAPGYLPKLIRDIGSKTSPNVFGQDGGLQIGPIPSGTPINLLSNIDIGHTSVLQLTDLLGTLFKDLKSLPQNATDQQAAAAFENAKGKLLAASKCPDFVVNRGHYFGTDFLPASEGEPGLSDADKRALIAYVKTF